MFIDADTHVDEDTARRHGRISQKSLQHLTPHTIEFDDEDMPPWLSGNRSSGSGYYRCWFIDGKLFPRRVCTQ